MSEHSLRPEAENSGFNGRDLARELTEAAASAPNTPDRRSAIEPTTTRELAPGSRLDEIADALKRIDAMTEHGQAIRGVKAMVDLLDQPERPERKRKSGERVRSPRFQRMIKVVYAIGLVNMAMTGVRSGMAYAEDGVDGIRDIYDPTRNTPEVVAEACPSEDAAIATEISRRAAEISPADLPRLRDADAESYRQFEAQYLAYAHERAEAHDLKLIDSEPYIEAVNAAGNVEGVFEALDAYGEARGFTIEMATEDAPLSTVPVSLDERAQMSYDIEQTRAQGELMIEAFELVPQELMDVVELNKITVVGSITDGSLGRPDSHPLATMQTATGDMVYSLESFRAGNYQVLMHELGHRLDYMTCGESMNSDPSFAALNDPDFSYDGTAVPENFNQNVVSKYASTNIVEDKAELYRNMLNGLNPLLAGDEPGQADEKYRLLLNRLEQKVPGVTSYLSDLSDSTTQIGFNFVGQSDTEVPSNYYQNEQLLRAQGTLPSTARGELPRGWS